MSSTSEKEMFTPRWRSFFSSLGWSISPVCIAAGALYFGPGWWRHSLSLLIPSAVMGLISLFLVVQDVFVHRQRLVLPTDGIGVLGWGQNFVKWSDVKSATIRERHNLVSGTDRLLILTSKNGNMLLAYPISVPSAESERRVLLLVRKMVPTAVQFDKATF